MSSARQPASIDEALHLAAQTGWSYGMVLRGGGRLHGRVLSARPGWCVFQPTGLAPLTILSAGIETVF